MLTNALEVESEYRIPLHKDLLNQYTKYPQLKIFNTDPLSNPNFIPKYSLKSEKLINLGMFICENFKIDLIESQYLLPYGYVACYLFQKYKIPYILRHAGSDLRRLLPSPSIHFLLKEVLLQSKKLITNTGLIPFFQEMGIKKNQIEVLNNQRDLNLTFFRPNGEKFDNLEKMSGFKVGFIGKPSIEKGIYQFIEILKRISNFDENILGFITCSESSEVRSQISQLANNLEIDDKVNLLNFQYPWSMPKLYRTLDAIICPESEFGIDLHNTVIPREAMACGTLTAISEEIYRKFPYNLEASNDAFLTFNSSKLEEFSERIFLILNDSTEKSRIVQNALKFSESIEKYEAGIKEYYILLQEILQEG